MKQTFLSHHSLNTNLATLILRLLFGGVFAYIGYQKILAYDQYVNNFPDLIGLGSKLSFQLVIFAEFFCGVLVTLGLFTRLSVIPIFITMAVAYFLAHKTDPFEVKQLPFVLMILSIVGFILGSGNVSLDKLIFGTRKKTDPPLY